MEILNKLQKKDYQPKKEDLKRREKTRSRRKFFLGFLLLYNQNEIAGYIREFLLSIEKAESHLAIMTLGYIGQYTDLAGYVEQIESTLLKIIFTESLAVFLVDFRTSGL